MKINELLKLENACVSNKLKKKKKVYRKQTSLLTDMLPKIFQKFNDFEF